MAKIDKHGIHIRGLKATAGYTSDCEGYDYYEIFYHRSTHEVWACSMLKGSCKHYDDPRVIWICDTEKHMAMQEIADKVYERVEFFRDLELRASQELERISKRNKSAKNKKCRKAEI